MSIIQNQLKLIIAALALNLVAMTPMASAQSQSGDDTGQAKTSKPSTPDEVKADEVILSAASWKKSSNDVRGIVRVVRTKDGFVLRVGPEFSTKSGPDLKFAFSTRKPADLNGKNSFNGALVIAPLKSERGTQEFAIPAGFDPAQHRTLIVHCEQYSKLWASAPLTAGDTIAASDGWKKKHKKTRGTWEIVKRDGRQFIRFSDDFKTAKAPPEPLRLILSPLSAKNAKHKTAMNGGVVIANLKSIKGGQEYEIPKDLDLAKYNSVLLHCEKYTKLWSSSTLQIARR